MSALSAFLQEMYFRYGDNHLSENVDDSLRHDYLVAQHGPMLLTLAKFAVDLYEAHDQEERDGIMEELGQEIEKCEERIRRRLVP